MNVRIGSRQIKVGVEQMVEQSYDKKKMGFRANGRIGSRQNKVGVEQTVEQIYAKKRWGSSKRQNSIKFKNKKDKGSLNGRIGWRQKNRTVE